MCPRGYFINLIDSSSLHVENEKKKKSNYTLTETASAPKRTKKTNIGFFLKLFKQYLTFTHKAPCIFSIHTV